MEARKSSLDLGGGQLASRVLMVRPTSFGFNTQTAASNVFARRSDKPRLAVRDAAVREFDAMVTMLRAFGVEVTEFDHGAASDLPDAVFPNNWLTTWPDGSVYIYPMAHEARRRERTQAVIKLLAQESQTLLEEDLSGLESTGQFLEGTGAMVFDHAHRIVYGCVSERCNGQLFTAHAKELGYRPELFVARSSSGAAIYHTNVMMGIVGGVVVICDEVISDSDVREQVLGTMLASGLRVISITEVQMNQFCGNVIGLANAQGEPCVLMSKRAYDAFTQEQRGLLASQGTILSPGVPTIEDVGGGGVRCMVAEIFLPVRDEVRQLV